MNWEKQFDEKSIYEAVEKSGYFKHQLIDGNISSKDLANFISPFIHKALQQQRAETLKEIRATEKMKFPLGERPWCIECAKRIRKHLINQLK